MILLSIWQYIKDKQINRGIKLWVLADSSNGCTVDFKIYIGKDSARGISKFGLGHDVKVRLISLYFNQCSLNMCNTSQICYFPTNFLWRCCPYNKEPLKLIFALLLCIIWVSLNSQFKF